jgi:spore maturation protein CgeB
VKLLLVETTQYAPASPLFLEAALGMTGVTCAFVDEKPYFAPIATSYAHRVLFRALGRRPPRLLSFERRLMAAAEHERPDVIVTVKGEYIRPQAIRALKARGAMVATFASDDPFNTATSSRYVERAIPEYDVYATPRAAHLTQLRRAGARRVLLLPFAFKPSQHFVDEGGAGDGPECDVAFIGGADVGRFAFFRRLIAVWPDIRLELYGGYWHRDAVLRRYARGFALGARYREVVRRALVVVNLVRRGNRDGHVMRSFELPACGGCMLAERTADHERFFVDGREAMFFSSADELVGQVRALKADRGLRDAVAAAGRARVTRDGHTYANRLTTLLDACATC